MLRMILSVIVLAGISQANTLNFQFSAGPGTMLNGGQSWPIEILPGNPPPHVPPNFGLLTISAGFEDWSEGAPCNPIDSSTPALCQGGVSDLVQVMGVVNGTPEGGVVEFGDSFENRPFTDDFNGYYTACTTPPPNDFSEFPDVQCYLPAGIYKVTLSISEYNSPITNAFVLPGTSTVTASIGGDVILLPEPNMFAPCFALLAITVTGRLFRARYIARRRC